jgi:hypothetical protein
MQSWIRDLIDLKTQISVLQNCMQQPASSHAVPASHYRVADNVNSGRGALHILIELLPFPLVCCAYDLDISSRAHPVSRPGSSSIRMWSAPRKYTFLYKCTSGFSSVRLLSACGPCPRGRARR